MENFTLFPTLILCIIGHILLPQQQQAQTQKLKCEIEHGNNEDIRRIMLHGMKHLKRAAKTKSHI